MSLLESFAQNSWKQMSMKFFTFLLSFLFVWLYVPAVQKQSYDI